MSMPTDWWREFFQGLVAEFWHAMPTPAMTAGDIDTLARLVPLPSGADQRVLDVPCGDGRHARELAARGCRVDAVDGSAELLAYARAQPNANVQLQQRDMRDLPWSRAFDLVCCLGNSFGYLGDDGDRAFLRAAHAACKPGGKLVVDATVLETLLPQLVPRRWYEAGGILFCSQVAFDPASGVMRSDYLLTRGSERQQRSAFVRVRSACETLAMFAEAGFASAVVRDDKGGPLQVGSPRAWFVASA